MGIGSTQVSGNLVAGTSSDLYLKMLRLIYSRMEKESTKRDGMPSPDLSDLCVFGSTFLCGLKGPLNEQHGTVFPQTWDEQTKKSSSSFTLTGVVLTLFVFVVERFTYQFDGFTNKAVLLQISIDLTEAQNHQGTRYSSCIVSDSD